MSEIAHAEHVEHADTVEVADHIGSLTVIAAPQTKAQTKAKSKINVLYTVAGILLLAVMLLALGSLLYVLHARAADQDAANRNQQIASQKIDDLTKQLAASSAATLDRLQKSNDKKDCAGGYSRSVALASVKYVQAVGQLSVAVALYPPGTPERVAASTKGLVAVNAADVVQEAAFNAQSAYFANGEPLPCDPKILDS